MIVPFANHSSERVTNRFLVDVIAFELAVDREETEDCFGTDVGFDEPEAFPFGTETNDRFEDGIILAAVDEARADIMIGEEVEKAVAFFGCSFDIFDAVDGKKPLDAEVGFIGVFLLTVVSSSGRSGRLLVKILRDRSLIDRSGHVVNGTVIDVSVYLNILDWLHR